MNVVENRKVSPVMIFDIVAEFSPEITLKYSRHFYFYLCRQSLSTDIVFKRLKNWIVPRWIWFDLFWKVSHHVNFYICRHNSTTNVILKITSYNTNLFLAHHNWIVKNAWLSWDKTLNNEKKKSRIPTQEVRSIATNKNKYKHAGVHTQHTPALKLLLDQHTHTLTFIVVGSAPHTLQRVGLETSMGPICVI